MSNEGERLRVLLDCRMARWSGVGRYTRGLVAALARRDDIAPVVVCHARDAASLTMGANAEVFSADLAPFSPMGSIELARIVRAARVDLTHCLHFPTPAPVRGPLVVTVHDLIPLVVEDVMPSAVRKAIFRAAVARALRAADAVVVPSAHTAADLERVFPGRARAVEVVAHGVDDFVKGPLAPLPANIASHAGTRFVLAMGSTRPHKGVPVLLEAFARIAEKDPSIHLLLVGPEPAGYLAAFAATTPLPLDRVAFTGALEDDVLRALYALATVFVSPSLYEGFGFPPLEAMVSGTPAIVTSAASLPEVVGDAALIVAPGDADVLVSAMSSLLSDASLAASLAEKGRARAMGMTWSDTAEKTARVYERVLSGAVA